VLEDPPRRITLGFLGGAQLELPASDDNLCVGSASVSSGGGFLLGQDHGPEGVWLIRVREKEPTATPSSGGSRFLPLGDLTSVPLLVDPVELRGTQPSGGIHVDEETLVQQLGEMAYERLFDPADLRDRIRWESDELGLQGNVALVGHHLYLRGSPAFLDWAASQIGELNRALASETVEIEVRMDTLERSTALALVATEDPESLAERLDHRLLGACRLGDSLLLLGGTERFYLVDYDVEIAQAAAIPDPIVTDLFEGTSFWCRPNRAGSGVLSAWIDLQVQAPAREMREIPVSVWEPRDAERKDDTPMPTGTYGLSALIELPATARAELTSNIRLPDGEWTLLCSTPLAGSDRQLVAVIRARARQE
jgi:HPt (histidine-containing phosphotransfer) domain-containing protein